MRSHVPPELLRRTIRQDIRPLASREPLFTVRTPHFVLIFFIKLSLKVS